MSRKPFLGLVVLVTALGAGTAGAHSGSATAGKGVGLIPQCSNRVDDDGDGLTDLADPGCSGPLDNSEYNPPPPQCSNGRDDDGDGKGDMNDPGGSGPLTTASTTARRRSAPTAGTTTATAWWTCAI